MENLQQEDLFGGAASIRSREDRCTVYRLTSSTGESLLQAYPVFPGIELIYDNIHAPSCKFPSYAGETILEIRHCREGRMEGSLGNEFYYMEPGDLSVSRPENGACFDYPLRHYHGITVIIDVDKAPRCLSCFLDDVNVQPGLLMEKFRSGSAAFVARSKKSIEHIFSELYSVPEEIKKGYLKVKVLELLLFLSSVDVGTDELAQRCYSQSQRLLASSVCQYLAEHMDFRVTLEQLTDLFHVSGTQIKNSIRAVYGTSLYSLVRNQKMESAAKMLRDTDMTILEVAGRHGYDNPSKFAEAFRNVMGMSPKEYRREFGSSQTCRIGAVLCPFGADDRGIF